MPLKHNYLPIFSQHIPCPFVTNPPNPPVECNKGNTGGLTEVEPRKQFQLEGLYMWE
jgi:hypothetical protein